MKGVSDPITNSVIASAANADILWQVYKIESSRGKMDGCRKKGLYNGFGYGQPDSAMANGTGACYKTFEEVVGKVDAWFTKREQEGLTIIESLCYYNTGHKLKECPYYDKYKTW